MRVIIDGRTIWINYHHLYCFYIIATEGGLTKAAKVLGIGQSALSIQMRQFEESIGFPLFERSPRKITPNERGKIVFLYAKKIFRLGSEMLETIHDQPTANLVHLQIGALDTIPKHLTVQVVQKALSEKPCTVSVTEGKPADLLKSLTDHKLDLVLMNFFPRLESEQVYVKRIAKLPLWVVGAKQFLKLKSSSPRSLAEQPFIIPTVDSGVRYEFDNFCKHIDITPHYRAEAQDVMVQKLLAIKNIGLTVMPEFAVREYLDKKELYLIGKLPNVFEEIFLVSAFRKIENPVASFLMSRFQIV